MFEPADWSTEFGFEKASESDGQEHVPEGDDRARTPQESNRDYVSEKHQSRVRVQDDVFEIVDGYLGVESACGRR